MLQSVSLQSCCKIRRSINICKVIKFFFCISLVAIVQGAVFQCVKKNIDIVRQIKKTVLQDL